MTQAERLGGALDDFERGDFEPFIALLDPGVRWDGRPRGYLWWRHEPT
jgi:hypothetical protein